VHAYISLRGAILLDLIHIALLSTFLSVVVWSLYNLIVLAVGVKNLRATKHESERKHFEAKDLLTFSIIVAVKNEAKVIGRLLEALSKLNYPADKMEIIIVEDGSTDETLNTCLEHARNSQLKLRILHKPVSNGKPSALNYGIKYAKGEIAGFFDADSVPPSDLLLNTCKYFEDPEVAAVQGRTLSINSEENMFTKFISYEEAVWCEAYLRGRDVLGLFVHLKGSCQFIRRDVLMKLKGFDENVLSEDMEFSVRLAANGHKTRYGADVRCWQENPADLKQMFRQRTRWLRGTMEIALKHGKLMTKPNRKNIDVEMTLFGPFILITSFITYLFSFYALLAPLAPDFLWQATMQFTMIVTTSTLFVCGLALIYVSKPKKLADLLWFPFIYFYWSLQTFMATYSLFLILLRRPREWMKTEKTGNLKNPARILAAP
jgi:cellulose synthase/poly-beta-1,6-N-acetylglucosamine synthase-like glycosyltransferase